MNDYYVYVYIDPRNFEEFYYGKGRGSRKSAHLSEESDKPKSLRIAAIREVGLEPIIRVIARNLSQHDALLVEKTLLWKLGRTLTNLSSGHYAENFRPQFSMHTRLHGFDYEKGLYYFNVGDGPCRQWEDYREHSFISAGQGPQWRNAIQNFSEGDVFAAFLKKKGFVGIGQILEPAKPIREVKINGKSLLKLPLLCGGMDSNVESDELCEYVCLVKWKRSVDREKAKWAKNSGLYTTTHIRAALNGQPNTVAFLEMEFNISLGKMIT